MPTVNDLIDTLCNDRPEVLSASRYDLSDFHRVDEDGHRLFPLHLASPRAQLRQLLENMAIRVVNDWDGPRIATAATRAMVGGEPQSAICEEYGITREQLYAFPLMAQAFPNYLYQEISGVQPLDRPDGKVFFLDGYKIEGVPSLVQFGVCSKAVCVKPTTLLASWSSEYHNGGLNALMTALHCVGREMALEQNYRLLRDLVEAAQQLQGDEARVGSWRDVDGLSNLIFTQRSGDATHLFLGPEAAKSWIEGNRAQVSGPGSGPEFDRYMGVTPLHENWGPGLKVYSVQLWSGARSRTVLALRRGQHWCDAPSVWAPHLFTVGNVRLTSGGPETTGSNCFTIHDKHEVVNPHSLAVMELE